MSGCFKLFPAHRFCLRVDEVKRREIEAERQGRRLAIYFRSRCAREATAPRAPWYFPP
jgi:hypothetical protein